MKKQIKKRPIIYANSKEYKAISDNDYTIPWWITVIIIIIFIALCLFAPPDIDYSGF